MKRIHTGLIILLFVAGCSSSKGELSERRTNCFGKLKPSLQSSQMVAVPKP